MSVTKNSVTRYADGCVQMGFRGRVFSGQGIQTVDVWVDDSGVVRVYDDVAEHWTTCHSISPRNLREIRQAARP